MRPDAEILFDVLTPLGFRVQVTRERWTMITTMKHPVMAGRESTVRTALEHPDQVRQSRSDAPVFLFYLAEGTSRWVCAVAKQTDDLGLLITAYPTDAIKEGTRLWPN